MHIAKWLLFLSLIGLGTALLVEGMLRYREETRVRDTVETYFEAIFEGDRDLAISLMHSPATIEEESIWEPLSGPRLIVRRIKVVDRSATAKVRVSAGGIGIEPDVSLVRTDAGKWLIDHIDASQYEREIARARELERTARRRTLEAELRDAFQDVEGVEIR